MEQLLAPQARSRFYLHLTIWSLIGIIVGYASVFFAGASAGEYDASAISSGDTAWLLASSALVMLMTPAVGFFYGGMVSAKNVVSVIKQSMIILALISVQWVLFGYSLAFGPDSRRSSSPRRSADRGDRDHHDLGSQQSGTERGCENHPHNKE
jgi:uncharacterized membrane protein